ncbi:MAG: hypothetical protein ACREF3_07740 [Acetobacteraceae bacterium]
MHAMTWPLALLVVAAVAARGPIEPAFAQNAPPAHPPIPGVAGPSFSGPGWGAEPEPPAAQETVPLPQLPVLFVTSVEILRSTATPELDIVRVTGLAATEGWSAPQLVPTYAGKPFDGILDLQLIATPSEQSEDATGFVPVSAIFEMDQGHPFGGVRVRGSENAITIKQIPGSAQVSVGINGCESCVGKKFAPDGTAPQPGQGVVRQEDLPKLLRIIKASDGIRGIEQDPNRLTLMLGEDNTILQAFWE